MASTQEWHYSRNGNQVGPVTAADLKRLASTGQLSPTDLIWKEGWEDWKPAAGIKGLFNDALPSTPVPPPLPVVTDAKASQTSGNVSDAVKSDLSHLMTSAKKAKDFAVAQTRKTQITQITLPKAYLALGKKLFDEGRFNEEFADLFQRISATNAEIEKVKASAKERPHATDLKGKLQSGAASLLAQGQGAKLGLQRDAQLRALGKKAFESHGTEAGTPDVVSPITTALDELQKIDARIAESSSGERVPLWQRIPVAAFLTLCCFPVGLYLLWHNPRISRRTKLIWGGGFACLLILGGIITRIEIENAKGELAAASELWSAGDKPAAISKYRALVKSHFLGVPQSERSVIIGRVIDFDAESGNNTSVEELLKIADKEHVVPSVSSDKARTLQANHLSETKRLAQQREEAEQKRVVESTAPNASQDASATFTAIELKAIKQDQRLSLAHKLGHLNQKNLSNYLEAKTKAERSGEWKGSTENTFFLMLLPSREWPNAARSIGLSHDEYATAARLILVMTNVPASNFDAAILDLTGESFLDYYSGGRRR
jgi:hypothetical protein